MIESVHIQTPDGKCFRLTDKNEKRLKKHLLSNYTPATAVIIQETGEELKLEDIFEV